MKDFSSMISYEYINAAYHVNLALACRKFYLLKLYEELRKLSFLIYATKSDIVSKVNKKSVVFVFSSIKERTKECPDYW